MMGPVVSAAILEAERARRAAAEEELRAVLSRVFRAGPGETSSRQARRILRLCGLTPKAAEVTLAIEELFPRVEIVRREVTTAARARTYRGLQVRPGFSVVEIAAYLHQRWKKRLPEGAVARYERILESEGLPADHTKLKDPSDMRNRATGTKVKRSTGDGIAAGSFEESGWTHVRHEAPAPGITAAMANAENARSALALRIPGFFDAVTGRGQMRRRIWELVKVEGMRQEHVAKALGKTENAVKMVVRQLSRRLDRFLKTGPDTRHLDDYTGQVPKGVAYLYANKWKDHTERNIWTEAVIARARPAEIAKRLELAQSVVTKALHFHRARAGLPLDET